MRTKGMSVAQRRQIHKSVHSKQWLTSTAIYIFPSFTRLQKWINDTITTTRVDIYGIVTKVQMLQKGSILKIWEVAIKWVGFKDHIFRLTVKKPKDPAIQRCLSPYRGCKHDDGINVAHQHTSKSDRAGANEIVWLHIYGGSSRSEDPFTAYKKNLNCIQIEGHMQIYRNNQLWEDLNVVTALFEQNDETLRIYGEMLPFFVLPWSKTVLLWTTAARIKPTPPNKPKQSFNRANVVVFEKKICNVLNCPGNSTQARKLQNTVMLLSTSYRYWGWRLITNFKVTSANVTCVPLNLLLKEKNKSFTVWRFKQNSTILSRDVQK